MIEMYHRSSHGEEGENVGNLLSKYIRNLCEYFLFVRVLEDTYDLSCNR